MISQQEEIRVDSPLTIEDGNFQEENVWPQMKCVQEKDDEEYGLNILMRHIFQSTHGVMFLILSTFLLIYSVRVGECANACAVMCLIIFVIVLISIHLIKHNIVGTSNDVSLGLLLRYYNFGTICIVLLIAVLQHIHTYRVEDMDENISSTYNDFVTLNSIGISYAANMLFYACIWLIFTLSLVLASFPGNFRRRCMRFFFMWPMNQTTKPSKMLHVLWITRQMLQIYVVGYVMAANGNIVSRLIALDYKAAKAQEMYFGAAFCEEYFKFMVAASIPFITKYNKNKSAVLNASIMVGIAFDLVESLYYCTREGWSSLPRLFTFSYHFVFAYPAALAITRQRDSIVWILELLGGFGFGILLHGSFNYISSLSQFPQYSHLKKISRFSLEPGLLLFGLIVLFFNPFLPKDKNVKKKKKILNSKRMDARREHNVTKTCLSAIAEDCSTDLSLVLV